MSNRLEITADLILGQVSVTSRRVAPDGTWISATRWFQREEWHEALTDDEFIEEAVLETLIPTNSGRVALPWSLGIPNLEG